MTRAADRLARALREAATAAGIAATVGPLTSRPWCSALFSGELHAAEVTGPDDARTAAWLGDLPEVELAIPGHVADVAIDRVTRCGGRLTATLALQTVEL